MKLDRRSFLAFGIGTTAGTTLSPLPWKLTDDSSIWTQNWPWTPVPQDGEATYENSVCTLCPGGCGITVRKIENRVVKIEGMKKHPVNKGGICALGLSGPQLLYSPSRVRTPLKRTGEKFVAISWDDAISEVVSKLTDLRDSGLSHTLACITGPGRGSVPYLFERFLTFYGSPNFFRTPSIQDSYEAAFKKMQNTEALPGFDLENADYVLSFGSGLIEGWGSPVYMFRANSKLKHGREKIVQIEPRLSKTAAKSDRWVPINPGTEAVLAMGMAGVIINQSMYNYQAVNPASPGFRELQQLINSKYGLNQVERITGISKSTIASLAREFASASKPLAVCGRGEGKTPGGLFECMAVHALNGLVGNINKPGGIWMVPKPGHLNVSATQQDTVASAGTAKGRIDGAGSGSYADMNSLLNRLPDIINTEKKDAVQALFVSEANPCYTMADSLAVNKAFDKIPFIVSFSSFMDETAQKAHLILPNHTNLERYEDVCCTSGYPKPVVGLSKPVVAPQYNTGHAGDVIIDLAGRMQQSIARAFPWRSYEECLRKMMGRRWTELSGNNYLFTSNAETMTAEFDFTPLVSLYHDPTEPEGDNAYTLTLMPVDSMRLSSGFIGSPPFLVKTVPDTVLKGQDCFVEINPDTAAENGLSEGDYAELKTPKGEKTVKIHLFEGIMPGIIAVPRGLGHTAHDDYPDDYLADKGINVNELIGPVEDPASGLDAAWGIRAKLTKV